MQKTEEIRETWAEIPGNKGYQISNIGRVLRPAQLIKNPVTHRWRVEPERLTNGTGKAGGYKKIGINGKDYSIHELVMLAFVGPRPYKYEINHKNGIKSDNKLSNLEYCTRSENVKHAWDTGLTPRKQQNRTGLGLKRYDIACVEHWKSPTNKI